DLRKAYWLVAGIGGGDPNDVSLGSAVWVDHVIDGDLAYELDARQIPSDWPTGYVPLGKATPYQQPMSTERAAVFSLDPDCRTWPCELTRHRRWGDSDELKGSAARFGGSANPRGPPFVARGDQVTASTFWHGSKMENWANEWARYYTAGKGNYMVCAMED